MLANGYKAEYAVTVIKVRQNNLMQKYQNSIYKPQIFTVYKYR